MANSGKLISPNFVEDTVSTAIQMYLTMMSFPFGRYSVIHFSKKKERLYGSDAYIERLQSKKILPFYLQFKRPFGYPADSKSHVVTDRQDLNASIIPKSLFFELRKKTPKQSDFQHNVLYALNNNNPIRGVKKAVYVCPLFFDKTEYFMSMHLSGLRRFWQDPFYFETGSILTRDNNFDFEQLPTISRHVTIQPHAEVNTANHKYSFDEYGKDICFHSPMRADDHAQSLSAYLMSIQKEFNSGEYSLNPSNVFEFLQRISEPFKDFVPDRELPIMSWLFFGDFLKSNYGIEQFAFIGEL